MLLDPLSSPDCAPLRETLLPSALRAFSEQGFDAVDLAAIAAQAGASEAFILECFGTKEELFAAAIDKALATVSASLGGGIPHRHEPTEGTTAMWPADLLMLILRSARDSRIAGILREHVERHVHGPLAAALIGPDSDQRAALYIALLTGVQLMQGILAGSGRSQDGLRLPADRMAALLQTLLE